MRQIFEDKDGNLSAKRIFGALAVVGGGICAAFSWGEPELVKALIYSGFVALGVTAFERKL